MKTRISRLFAPATLLAWGGVFVYFYGSGRLQSFLHPSLRPLVLITGLGLLITGLLLRLSDGHSTPSEPSGLALPENPRWCLDGCGRTHAPSLVGDWFKPLLMLLSLVIAAVISPDGFGAAFVRNRTSSPSRTIPRPGLAALPAAASDPAVSSATTAGQGDGKSQYLQTDAAGHVKAELVDFRYAAQSPDLRKDFEHKVLEVTGQFLPVPGADRQHFTVTRLFLICCAADAQPINVSVEMKAPAAVPPNLPEMSWVRITGTVRFENTDQIVSTPIIIAESIQLIPPPKERYLY